MDLSPEVSFSASHGGMGGAFWSHTPVDVRLGPLPSDVLCWHFGGSMDVTAWEDEHPVGRGSRPGSFAVIPAGRPTRWQIGGCAQVLHLYLPPGHADRVLIDRLDPCLDALMRALSLELRPHRRSVRSSESLLLDQIAQAVSERVKTHHGRSARQKRPRGGLSAAVLRNVLAFIDVHVGERLRLEELAALAGLSEGHFLRAFRQSTNTTPHQFLVRRRLERANELVRTRPDLTLVEIARACGFANGAHFSSSYRTRFGEPPSAARR